MAADKPPELDKFFVGLALTAASLTPSRGSRRMSTSLPTHTFFELESRLRVLRELQPGDPGQGYTDNSETHFVIGELTYKLFDVGGQRSER